MIKHGIIYESQSKVNTGITIWTILWKWSVKLRGLVTDNITRDDNDFNKDISQFGFLIYVVILFDLFVRLMFMALPVTFHRHKLRLPSAGGGDCGYLSYHTIFIPE